MAYDFNGAGTQYLTLPANAAFQFGTGDFTISLWVYLDSFVGGATDVIASTYQDSSNGWTFGVFGATDKFYFAVAGDAARLDDTGAVITGSWVHLAARRSGTALTFWVNGTQKAFATNSTNQTSSSSLTIGTNVGGGSLQLNGKVAELCVWKGLAATDAQIASMAKGFAPATVLRASISLYMPLVRNLVELKQGLTITNNNSASVSAHPRIYS